MKHMTTLLCSVLAAGIFALDLLLKNQVERKLEEGGAFLDIGEKKQGAVACLSLFLTLCMTVVFLSTFTFRGNSTLKAGLAFLLGGAYSNTYDRLVRKYVVDYVSFPVRNPRIRRIVFNISDFCILIGALLMTVAQIRES